MWVYIYVYLYVYVHIHMYIFVVYDIRAIFGYETMLLRPLKQGAANPFVLMSNSASPPLKSCIRRQFMKPKDTQGRLCPIPPAGAFALSQRHKGLSR